jgi:pentachlorophenol monooxygenase
MSEAPETQVLITGAGPIGMTAAIELARRGIACRIVDPLVEPPQYAKAVGAAHGRMDVYLIAAPGADVVATGLPVVVDSGGEFARAYEPSGPSAYIVRPDGYLGLAAAGVDPAQLVAHLRATFALPEGGVTG